MGSSTTCRCAFSFLLISLISILLEGCSSIQADKVNQSPAGAQSTFVYVGEMATTPGAISTPAANTDALTSYQLQIDGSLKLLGSLDRSVLPDGILEYASAGPWIFTCDARPVCQEFRADDIGKLVAGADISAQGLHHVGVVHPSGNWLIASNTQGEQVFRIQADGNLTPVPNFIFPPPPPPIPPDAMQLSIVTFDPTGNLVLAVDPVNVVDMPGGFIFDPTNGTLKRSSVIFQLVLTGFHFVGFTSDGRHAIGVQKTDAGTGAIQIFDWDPNTGNMTFHGQANLPLSDVMGFFPSSLAIAGDLIFVQGGITDSVVLRFDPASVTISDTGQRFPNDFVVNGSLRADERAHTLVATSPLSALIGVWTYNPMTGETRRSPGSPLPSGQNPQILGILSR